MKELTQNKINEYMHDLEKNDLIEDEEDIKLEKEKIGHVIKILEDKINEHTKLENDLNNVGINEVNLTDTDAKTVKFDAQKVLMLIIIFKQL